MSKKADYLEWVDGFLNALVLCYPDRFSENTGPYEKVLSRLFEEWDGFRSCIKQDMDKVDEFEAEIRRALALMESGEIKAGKFLLQDLERELPKLEKFK